MRIERRPSTLTLSLRRHPTLAGRIGLALAGLLPVFLFAAMLWMVMHGPTYEDRFGACTGPADCPLTDAEWGEYRPSFKSPDAFLAVAGCVLLEEGGIEMTQREVAEEAMLRREPCTHIPPVPADLGRPLLEERERWIAPREKEAWRTAVLALQEEALARYQRASRDRVWTLTALATAGLGSLGLLLWVQRTRQRPMRIRLTPTRLVLGRRELHFRYLRHVSVEEGRLQLFEIEHQLKTPVLDEEALPALASVLGQELCGVAHVDLDRLEASLRAALPDLADKDGTTVEWTHQGAMIHTAPAHRTRWRRVHDAAGLSLAAAAVFTGWTLVTLGPEVTGSVSAAACASGEARCTQARPDGAFNSLHAFASRRVCQLVDAPIRDAYYDDAAAIGREERVRTSKDLAERHAAALPGPCRDDAWELGDPVPELMDLWLAGPRNANVAEEQIAELQREAEALIREEWLLYRAVGSVGAWEAAIAWERVSTAVTLAGTTGAVVALLLLLLRARRRVHPVDIELQGQILVVGQHRLPFTRIASIGIDGRRLVIELEDGESIRTVPLERPGEIEPFVAWVRSRMQGTQEPPEEIRRLRGAVERARH